VPGRFSGKRIFALGRLATLRTDFTTFLRRHPLVRDALIWAIPALIVGAVLRGLLLSYLPFAYWGSDSRSYFGFTEQLLDSGKISLYDKRRYLYLLGMLPVTLLPGSFLRWLAWLQHLGGLATLVPLAYCVRKAFTGWKLWVVPVTVAYAGLPILLWYEHEMLAECVFFHLVIWMLAGWMAFAPARGVLVPGNFWWFFAGFAGLVLTKPAGAFFWPAVALALIAVAAWRVLRRVHWCALAGLAGLQMTIGQDTQGAWLLYTSAFPLTQLESPLHAEYKAQIADKVRTARAEIFSTDRGPDSKEWKQFLKFPERQSESPLWAELGRDDARKQRVYRDLAHEGIRAHPFLFLRIALGKILASANPGEFKTDRFLPSYYLEKYEVQYRKDATERPARIRKLFGLPRDEPLPDYAALSRRIAPDPQTSTATSLRAYAEAYHRAARLIISDDEDDPTIQGTVLAWWLLVGAALAFSPVFFRPLGLPLVMVVSYLFGTYLVGGVNPRYFGAVWGVLILLLGVPLDLLWRGARRCLGK
jgi:hypothetical protein